MKTVGTLILMDSVSAMNRDRVNFEDRVISAVKRAHHGISIHSRSVRGKTTPHCIELLRSRSGDYREFAGQVDIGRAYIILGLAEENHALDRRWFETTMHHIVDELIFIGFSPCIVSCRKKSPLRESRTFDRVQTGRKEVYVNRKSQWNSVACFSMQNISKQRNIDMLKCDISCPRQWDTISLDSSRKLTYLISNDLDYIINREQL
jgi:hypothetical protein